MAEARARAAADVEAPMGARVADEVPVALALAAVEAWVTVAAALAMEVALEKLMQVTSVVAAAEALARPFGLPVTGGASRSFDRYC